MSANSRALVALAALVAPLVTGTGPTAAGEGRWCAHPMDLGSDCTLSDWDQCVRSVLPLGGTCQANPNYRGPATTAAKTSRRATRMKAKRGNR